MSGIMIVDDDAIIVEELEEILKIDGYDVVKALYSPEGALEWARTLRPDLILMDIVFFGRNGRHYRCQNDKGGTRYSGDVFYGARWD